MKKILTSIILVLSLFLLVSCGTKEETKEVVGNQAEVAIILKTLSNPFWVSMKEGIEYLLQTLKKMYKNNLNF